MELFNTLNAPQREAIETLEGPLLVLAGAGSGKTRVVTFRIVNLIEQGVSPHHILGLTFTNKAAGEMKERIRSLTESNVLISTFHSLGARILRESIQHLGYQRDFTIYDEEDVDKVIKASLLEADLKADIKPFRLLISKAKNNMQTPDQVSGKEEKKFPEVYARYQAKLKEYNALDFDDLLFLTVRLLKEHQEVLEMYQNRWRYLLVDEYQDTNNAQYMMIQYLVGPRRNVCVVGDPDQSIYSWRGANIRNILDFENDYPGAKIIRLEQNYRSRANILEAANAVIRRNGSRFDKELWSDLGAGERIKLFVADDEKIEAGFIADKIRYYGEEKGVPFNEMAVFYRTNSQSRAFEDIFLQRRIPYKIVGGLSFYQRKEVKDILAYLRMVHSGNDFVSFNRTINIPKRGLGESSIEKLRLAAFHNQMSIVEYCEAWMNGDGLSEAYSVKLAAKQKNGLQNYLQTLRSLKQIQASCSLKELVEATIEYSGYLDYLKEDAETFDDRKGNLNALLAKAVEWELSAENPTLACFLEELSLRSTLDEASGEESFVALMTIHNGKGLEYQLTFLAGLEEELFPHVNSRNDEDKLEEERRLFYVGMTRAKDFLYLTCCRSRFIWGTSRSQRPSRFIREIPFEYIEKVRLGADYTRPSYKGGSAFSEEERFSDEQESSLKPGDAVFHKEFGVGIVREVSDHTLGLVYKIRFSKDEKEKTLVAKHASLIKI